MDVEQALNAADQGEKEGLVGLYPMAAQVLAAEVRRQRELLHIARGVFMDIAADAKSIREEFLKYRPEERK